MIQLSNRILTLAENNICFGIKSEKHKNKEKSAKLFSESIFGITFFVNTLQK